MGHRLRAFVLHVCDVLSSNDHSSMRYSTVGEHVVCMQDVGTYGLMFCCGCLCVVADVVTSMMVRLK